jgi:hypothetical protein
MTDNNHPITPPPELVVSLRSEAPHGIRDAGVTRELHLITAAYRAGADQELEACCEWADATGWYGAGDMLRTARRSKPPSLKAQALELVDRIEKAESVWAMSELDTIRRALESLPD